MTWRGFVNFALGLLLCDYFLRLIGKLWHH